MDEIWTVSEAARWLQRSGESVRNYERKGILPALKTARGVRLFRASDVRALAEKQRAERHGFQKREEQSEPSSRSPR